MKSQSANDVYDAVIVGARCAGAATGMLLASAGLRVLVFDKGQYGTDTLSTHALMRPAVLLLHRWGLLERLEHAGTPRITRTTFHYADEQGAREIAVDIKPRHGIDALYAPRRTALDRILVDAARDAGAEVRHGVQLADLLRSADGRISGVRTREADGTVRDIHAGIVIGADGRRSGVARLAGATPYVMGRHMTSCAYGYFRDLPIDGNRWYYRPGMGAGVIPTNERKTLIFASVAQDFAGACARISSSRFRSSTRYRGSDHERRALCEALLLRRHARSRSPAVGRGMGARRRCGIHDRPDHRTRDHQCAARCRAPHSCNHRRKESCRVSNGA
jgi:flavin-dependent dehydrogenase